MICACQIPRRDGGCRRVGLGRLDPDEIVSGSRHHHRFMDGNAARIRLHAR